MTLTSGDLADIEQLMEATITAALKDQTKYIDKRFDEQDEKLDTILDAIGGELARQDSKLDSHETRLTALEQQAV